MSRKIGVIHWKKFEGFLLAHGCTFKREKGDHRVYTKSGLKRPIIVPRDSELQPVIVQNNLRTLGISKETYLDYLGR
ncbi:MAG: type II toxin-antitoxin system HicA family toxin [bacterium]|nr:type II toxin-antitoxin system HicA family toxin [bacterium]